MVHLTNQRWNFSETFLYNEEDKTIWLRKNEF